MKIKIITNKLQCKHCGDIIESKTVNDFKMCSCGKIGVDGGTEYLRWLGESEDYIDLSEYTLDGEVVEKKKRQKTNK